MTALVFDRLSPEARKPRRAGGARYLGTKEEAAGLPRHFRHRPGADTLRAVHPECLRAASGARDKVDGRASPPSIAPEQNASGRQRWIAGGGSRPGGRGAEAAGGPGASAAIGATRRRLLAQMAVEDDQRTSTSWSATSKGIHDQRPLRDHQHAAPVAGAQEPRALFRRDCDSSRGAAPVSWRDRCREPRQRQHLHHGRGGPARRKRAGGDPRSGERGRSRGRRPTRVPAATTR